MIRILKISMDIQDCENCGCFHENIPFTLDGVQPSVVSGIPQPDAKPWVGRCPKTGESIRVGFWIPHEKLQTIPGDLHFDQSMNQEHKDGTIG